MNYKIIDFGKLCAVFLESELVFLYERAVASVKPVCRDFEYADSGIILYGSEKNGLLRSHIALSFSDKAVISAMHDGRAEIAPLNGSKICLTESENGYEYSVTNGENRLTLGLDGSCRCEGNNITVRRGRTGLRLSEPSVPKRIGKRRGFEYEAEMCLTLIGSLSAESELLPLLILIDGLKGAYFDEARAESAMKDLKTMSAQNKKTAEAVMKRYYRAFGKNEMGK